MKKTILALALCLLGFAVFSQSRSIKKSETIVLVHGAWSDASCWAAVTPLLKAQGYDVIAVNLPGHGKDNTSFASISLQSYVDLVTKAIGSRTNVILVGHSLGGIIISQVAEAIPTQIKELVYVAAFLPKDGESLLSIAKADAGSHANKYLQVDQAHGAASIEKDGFADVFAADAPQPILDNLVANSKPEPLAPLATPVKLSDANFGSVKKSYVYTINDHTLSYPLQQSLVANGGVTRVFALPSSHNPFYSMPGVLAAIILQEAE
jgi:pimeloyl-ACP methyl ester carboxylesterase